MGVAFKVLADVEPQNAPSGVAQLVDGHGGQGGRVDDAVVEQQRRHAAEGILAEVIGAAVLAGAQVDLHLLDAGRIQLALVEGYYPQEEYEHTRYSTGDYIGVCAAAHHFAMPPHRFHDLLQERLLIREEGSGTRNILERNLALYGMKVSDFIHYTEVGNMHTIIGLLLRDAGISFLYRIAVEAELRAGKLREIPLAGFTMQHDFDFIWEKGSIYTDAYTSFCEELRSLAGEQDSSNFPDRQGRAGAGSNTPVE
mgnify:CR=1 FL=1